MGKNKLDNSKQAALDLRLFKQLVSQSKHNSQEISHSPVSYNGHDENENLNKEQIKAKNKSLLRTNLPFILNDIDEIDGENVFAKTEEAFDALKSFPATDFNGFIGKVNESIRRYYSNIINDLTKNVEFDGDQIDNPKPDVVTEELLAYHFCRMLQNPTVESGKSSLEFFEFLFSQSYNDYISPAFACGGKNWPPHLRQAWAIFRANILSMKSQKETVDVGTIRELAIQLRFRCAELNGSEFIKYQ